MNDSIRNIVKFCLVILLALMPIATRANPEPEENRVAEEYQLAPLPEWSNEDLQRLQQGENLILGSLFFGDADGDDVIELSQPGPDLAVQPPPSDIPDAALEKYFLQPIESLLLDPQGILSNQEYLDIEGFLKYHSEESALDLCIYLFDAEQKIPNYYQVDNILKRHEREGRQTAVIYYFYGNPARTELNLTAEITGKIGNQERLRCLQNSINTAAKKSQDFDQLEAFSMQMSILVVRLEKALADGQDLSGSALVTTPTNPALLGEKATKLHDLYGKFQAYILPTLLIFSVACVAWIFSRIIKNRKTYRLEEYEIPPRLGANQAAGIGGVISYSSTSKPVSFEQFNAPTYQKRR